MGKGHSFEFDRKLERIGWSRPDYLNLEWDWKKIDGRVGPNDSFPVPYKEINREEFEGLFHCGTYGLTGIGYSNNVYLPDEPVETRKGLNGWTIHYHFFPHYGLAVATRYMAGFDFLNSRHKNTGYFLPGSGGAYGYAFRYYRLGCEHKWIELTQDQCWKRDIAHYGGCYHVNECINCGEMHEYDSSD